MVISIALTPDLRDRGTYQALRATYEPLARWLVPRFGIPSHTYCTVYYSRSPATCTFFADPSDCRCPSPPPPIHTQPSHSSLILDLNSARACITTPNNQHKQTKTNAHTQTNKNTRSYHHTSSCADPSACRCPASGGPGVRPYQQEHQPYFVAVTRNFHPNPSLNPAHAL